MDDRKYYGPGNRIADGKNKPRQMTPLTLHRQYSSPEFDAAQKLAETRRRARHSFLQRMTAFWEARDLLSGLSFNLISSNETKLSRLGFRVLIVEPDPATAMLYKSFLAEYGFHKVYVARSNAEAMTAARANPYHLILSVYEAETVDGNKLRKELSALGHATTVVFVSGYTDDQYLNLKAAKVLAIQDLDIRDRLVAIGKVTMGYYSKKLSADVRSASLT